MWKPRVVLYRRGFDAKTRRASVFGVDALKPMLDAGCSKTSDRSDYKESIVKVLEKRRFSKPYRRLDDAG
jgi:hypothetical protein